MFGGAEDSNRSCLGLNMHTGLIWTDHVVFQTLCPLAFLFVAGEMDKTTKHGKADRLRP